MQDYISDKAIWEGSIPSEDEKTQVSPLIQSQPQMMFCYKCNNVIPGDSKYCPCCKVELFTTCPNCGKIYSSQYHICNKCGTDRNEYLRLQKIERERQEEIERENQRQRERLEREKQEREQQEKEYHKHCEARRREQREAYARKKAQIMNTEEYQSTYSILREALKVYRRKYMMIIVLLIASFVLFCIILDDWGIMNERVGIATGIAVAGLVLLPSFGLAFGIILSVMQLRHVEKREQYIWQYIGKKDYDYDKDILEYVVKKIRNSTLYIYDILENLSEWCIEAYRNKKRKKIDILP